MTAHHDRQARLRSTYETGADDGLSVVLIQDHADAVNNAVYYAFLFKVAGQPCAPWWYSHASTTEERVVGLFAGRDVPMGLNYLSWGLGHLRTAGSGSVTWRLYAARTLYTGPVAFDATRLGSGYASASVVTSSGTHDVPAPNVDCGPIVRSDSKVWLVLTAQASDASSRAALTDFDIWPVIV